VRLGGTGLRVSSTFLDTSDVYPIGGNLGTVGRTEEIIGRWLARDGATISSSPRNASAR